MAAKNTNHPREKIMALYYFYEEEGLSKHDAGRKAGVAVSTASNLLRNPTKWDPFYDEVALERALKGDRAVFEALTIWEHMEFNRRAGELRDSMPEWHWQIHSPWLREQLGIGTNMLDHRIRRAK